MKDKKNGSVRKIVIAGSAAFWAEALEYKKKLEGMGYEVLAYVKEEDGTQSWRELYEWFYGELAKADDIFVLNLDKKGIKGYIGYETFAELSNVVVRRMNGEDAKAYLCQLPSKECGCYEEIMEMKRNGWVEVFGGDGWVRTNDQSVMSRLL